MRLLRKKSDSACEPPPAGEPVVQVPGEIVPLERSRRAELGQILALPFRQHGHQIGGVGGEVVQHAQAAAECIDGYAVLRLDLLQKADDLPAGHGLIGPSRIQGIQKNYGDAIRAGVLRGLIDVDSLRRRRRRAGCGSACRIGNIDGKNADILTFPLVVNFEVFLLQRGSGPSIFGVRDGTDLDQPRMGAQRHGGLRRSRGKPGDKRKKKNSGFVHCSRFITMGSVIVGRDFGHQPAADGPPASTAG
jgi:hypothetical protein